MNLPTSLPHEPPTGYHYEVEQFKPNVVSIWLRHPDHFNYTNEEISNIKKRAENIGAKIITTEKDYVKIPYQNRDNINFCEVNLRIDNEEDLTNFIKTKINEIH